MDAVVMFAFALIVSYGLGFGGLVRLLFCALFAVVVGLVGVAVFYIAILWGLLGYCRLFVGVSGRLCWAE